MASIVDVDNAPGDLDGLVKNLSEAVTQSKDASSEEEQVRKSEPSDVTQQKAKEQEQQQSKDPLAGTKFEGKSVEDILDSYNNLQSAYGRMANDLGSQRKLTDQLLNLKREEDLQQNTPVAASKVDTADLLEDPTKALDAYLATRESRIRQEYDEKLGQFESQLQADKFMAKHPDFMELGQSSEFQTWALENPLRSRVAHAAAQGDFDAADVLLTEYKAQAPKKKQDTPVTDPALEEARKLSLESAAQGGGDTKKIYRRADLIDLKINKPNIYSDPAFQAEILKAYSEGRVK